MGLDRTGYRRDGVKFPRQTIKWHLRIPLYSNSSGNLLRVSPGSLASPGAHPERAISRAIPVPSSPPTQADWAAYRPIFEELYLTRKMTLKETMREMRDQYGFQATEKMYKTRVAAWGLHKYHRKSLWGTSSRSPQQQSTSGIVGTQASISPPVYIPGPSPDNLPALDEEPIVLPQDLFWFQAANMTQLEEIVSDSPPDPSQVLRTVLEIDHGSADLGLVPPFTPTTSSESASHTASARVLARRRKRQKTNEAELTRYLAKTQPDLALTRFRAISKDLEIVESILDQIHSYYDEYSVQDWTRTFPSSPRTVMKEMTMCIDLHAAFPVGQETIVHPTLLFGRYLVALELLKSAKKTDQDEGWRLVHEAFELFKPVLAQQHTQLLRYFFQQASDYRLNEHPDIRRQIFELAANISAFTLGPKHPITNICRLLPQVEDKDEICVLAWRKSLELIDENIGEASEESLRSKLALAGDLIDQTKFDQAEELLVQMLSIPGLDPTDYYVRSVRFRLGWLYRLQGRHKEAEDMLHQVMKLSKQLIKPGTLPSDALYIGAEVNLAKSMSEREEFRTSEYILEAALERCASNFGPKHGYTVSVQDELDALRESMAALNVG